MSSQTLCPLSAALSALHGVREVRLLSGKATTPSAVLSGSSLLDSAAHVHYIFPSAVLQDAEWGGFASALAAGWDPACSGGEATARLCTKAMHALRSQQVFEEEWASPF